MDIERLISRWRAKADVFRPYFPATAKLIDDFTAELEEYVAQHALEALTIAQAARESHCHPDTIARRLKDGTFENVGTRGAPRVRRRDLQQKVAPPRPTPPTKEPDLVGEVLNARTNYSLEK